MAINKRKDSAALFELIDKSTLKVPKHTGSLKIPSWWSSKSNPPAPASTTISTTNGNAPAAHAPEPHSTPQPAPPEIPPQPRLFEPPPADVPAASSPTIRPPAPPSGPRFAMVTAADDTSPENAPATTLPTDEISEQELDPEPAPSAPSPRSPANSSENYAGLGAGRRVFAPQTMSQTDSFPRDWASQQKARLARAPLWAMVSAAATIVILLALILYAFTRLHAGPTPANASTNSNATPLPGPPSHPSILPPQSHNPGPVAPPNENHPLLNTNPDTPAQVYQPHQITRNLDLYYIEVLTTSVPANAQKDAELLAKNGVDISIETQRTAQGRWLYILFSVDGFKTITDAGPLQKKIVAAGHQLPEFARTHKAWDDATIIKWSAVLRAASRN